MFSIFKKPSTILLDCFTVIPDLPELFPIVESKNMIPNWWKKLDTTVEFQGVNRGTMKTCPGVVDYFKSGFVLQAWRDFQIQINSGIPSTYPDDAADQHNPIQWGTGLDGYAHIKLVSPWRIKEKTGVKFLFTNSFWNHHQSNYFVPNGIVEYKHQSTTNVNMVVSKKIYPNSFTINAGDPLVQCIPLSDKNIKIKMHVVSAEEFVSKDGYHFAFSSNYYKTKKFKERNKK